jgi:hypothetical protein
LLATIRVWRNYLAEQVRLAFVALKARVTLAAVIVERISNNRTLVIHKQFEHPLPRLHRAHFPQAPVVFRVAIDLTVCAGRISRDRGKI